MKFFAPKTIRESFSPWLFIDLIFGIGFIEYPPGNPRLIISAICSMITFSIYLILVMLSNASQMTRFIGSSLIASNFRIYAHCFTAYIAFALCLSQINAKVIRNSFAKIDSINERLKKLGIPEDYNLNFKAQVIHLVIGFAFAILLTVLYLLSIRLKQGAKQPTTAYIVCIHYRQIFSFICNFGCVTSNRYIANRFKRLNWLLEEPNLHKMYETRFNREPNDRDIHLNTLTLREIRGNLMASDRIADKREMLYIIRESRKIHRDLCTTTTELNGAFGIQLLFSLALSVILLTTFCYNGYVAFTTRPDSWALFDVLSKIIPIFRVLFYSANIFVVIHADSNASDEAKRTGQLIHTLLNSTIIYNEGVRDELKMFSLQLIQNPLKITACGFFTIDYEFAFAVFGSVTTFLIIILQMRYIYEY